MADNLKHVVSYVRLTLFIPTIRLLNGYDAGRPAAQLLLVLV